MALTGDIKIIRYGVPGNSTQPNNLPGGANQLLYRGSVATTRAGYLVEATAPASTDVVWGLIENGGPGVADTGPGIQAGSTNGSITVEIATGSFWLNSATGAGAITQANVGQTVYLLNENTVTTVQGSGVSALPPAGVVEAVAASMGNTQPFTNMIAVKLGNNQSAGAPS